MLYVMCTQKKYTKAYCSLDNITIKMVDDFIEEQRNLYYLNIRTAIQLKLIYLQGQLVSVNETNKNDKNNDFKVKNKKINELKNKMTKLMDNFMNDNNSEAMQELISKKLQDFDIEIKQLESVPKSELSRQEWLNKVNKIIVIAKGKFDVEYKLE